MVSNEYCAADSGSPGRGVSSASRQSVRCSSDAPPPAVAKQNRRARGDRGKSRGSQERPQVTRGRRVTRIPSLRVADPRSDRSRGERRGSGGARRLSSRRWRHCRCRGLRARRHGCSGDGGRRPGGGRCRRAGRNRRDRGWKGLLRWHFRAARKIPDGNVCDHGEAWVAGSIASITPWVVGTY